MGWRLGEQQVDVLRHDDVAEEFETVFLTDGFEGMLEDSCGPRRIEIRLAAVTAEGDEVEVAGLLSTFKAWWH